MKSPCIILSAAALVLFAVGCETTGGIPGRVHEKAAVYATLQRWEKKYIDRGIVAVGFTPDMIYMAVGRPSKIEPSEGSDGKAELWSYKHFFPAPDANYAPFGKGGAEPAKPPPGTMSLGEARPAAKGIRSPGDTVATSRPSSFTTGGPQGGSIEPSDLQSYTLYVLFEDGKATKVGINPE
jgi:hypothetical protein